MEDTHDDHTNRDDNTGNWQLCDDAHYEDEDSHLPLDVYHRLGKYIANTTLKNNRVPCQECEKNDATGEAGCPHNPVVIKPQPPGACPECEKDSLGAFRWDGDACPHNHAWEDEMTARLTERTPDVPVSMHTVDSLLKSGHEVHHDYKWDEELIIHRMEETEMEPKVHKPTPRVAAPETPHGVSQFAMEVVLNALKRGLKVTITDTDGTQITVNPDLRSGRVATP